MPMALYTSNLISTPVITPAKSMTLILRTPSLILGFRSPIPSSSTLSAKPISQSAFANLLRASPPRQYVYPDPIPEFAEAETQKFRAELLTKLLKDKDTFGDELDAVIDVCAEVLGAHESL